MRPRAITFMVLKLHAVMDAQGYFRAWEVTAANVDDRRVAEELLLAAPHRFVLADGGAT
nr:transposase [Lentilactobacillus raoultii]